VAVREAPLVEREIESLERLLVAAGDAAGGAISRRRIQGRALIAERDGVAIAAIGLTSGAVAADPFNRTAEAVSVLRERRYRMLRQGGDTGNVHSLLRRLAPQTA
jgi:hypothetical protein